MHLFAPVRYCAFRNALSTIFHMSESTTGLVDHLLTFSTAQLHTRQTGLRPAYFPAVRTTFGRPVLRLTRVEANVDSLDEGLLGFFEGRLRRTRYKGDLRGFLKRRRCWGLLQLLLATVGCYEEFKVEGLQGSVHSRVVRRLREIQGEQSRFKLRK